VDEQKLQFALTWVIAISFAGAGADRSTNYSLSKITY